MPDPALLTPGGLGVDVASRVHSSLSRSRAGTPQLIDRADLQEQIRLNAITADNMQMKTFANWINAHLDRGGVEGMQVVSFGEDLRDGKVLLRLLEVLSAERLHRPEKNNMRFHKIANVGNALKFLALKLGGLMVLTVSAEEVVDGNIKLTLGLIWIVLLRFQINKDYFESGGTDEEIRVRRAQKTDAKASLLAWVRAQLASYEDRIAPVTDFHRSWQNGEAFMALIHSHRSHLVPHLKNYLGREWPEAWAKTLTTAFHLAKDKMGIPMLLDVQDIAYMSMPDEKSIMTYVSEFYVAMTRNEDIDNASVSVSASEEDFVNEPAEPQIPSAMQAEFDTLHENTIRAGEIVGQIVEFNQLSAGGYDNVASLEVAQLCVAKYSRIAELVENPPAIVTSMQRVVFKYPAKSKDPRPDIIDERLQAASAALADFDEAIATLKQRRPLVEQFALLDGVAAQCDQWTHALTLATRGMQNLPSPAGELVDAAMPNLDQYSIALQHYSPQIESARTDFAKQKTKMLELPRAVFKTLNYNVSTQLTEATRVLKMLETLCLAIDKFRSLETRHDLFNQRLKAMEDFIPASVEAVFGKLLADARDLDTNALDIMTLLENVRESQCFAFSISAPVIERMEHIQKALSGADHVIARLKSDAERKQRFDRLENACRDLVGRCEVETEFVTQRLGVLMQAIGRPGEFGPHSPIPKDLATAMSIEQVDHDTALANHDPFGPADELQQVLVALYADLAHIKRSVGEYGGDADTAMGVIRYPEQTLGELANSIAFEREFIVHAQSVSILWDVFQAVEAHANQLAQQCVGESGDVDAQAQLSAVQGVIDVINTLQQKRSVQQKALGDMASARKYRVHTDFLDALFERYMSLEQQGVSIQKGMQAIASSMVLPCLVNEATSGDTQERPLTPAVSAGDAAEAVVNAPRRPLSMSPPSQRVAATTSRTSSVDASTTAVRARPKSIIPIRAPKHAVATPNPIEEGAVKTVQRKSLYVPEKSKPSEESIAKTAQRKSLYIPDKKNKPSEDIDTKTVQRKSLYIPDKKNKLDLEVSRIMDTMPSEVKLIRDDRHVGRYWIGDQDKKLLLCRFLNDKMVMVRVGGGWSELSRFLKERAMGSDRNGRVASLGPETRPVQWSIAE